MFLTKWILTHLLHQELNKAQLKPFLMRIWGQQENGNGNKEEKNDEAEAEGTKTMKWKIICTLFLQINL